MKFFTKLVVFAVGLTAIMGVYRISKLVRGDQDPEVAVEFDMPARPARPEPPEPPEPVAVAGQTMTLAPLTRETPLATGEVRIHTRNGAGYLSLRDSDVIAGFSDSLVQAVQLEMHREMQKSTDGGKLGEFIKDAVQSGVNKIMQQQVTIPVSEIRDIDYRGGAIVLRYRREQKDALVKLETIKLEGETPFLESFKEEDARRLVEAVKAKVR